MGNTHAVVSDDKERATKRRDVSGIAPSRRSLTGSRSKAEVPVRTTNVPTTTNPLHEVQLNLSENVGRTSTLQAFNPDSFLDRGSPRPENTASPSTAREVEVISSPAADSDTFGLRRQSAAFSELASTFGGSDSEARFKDDDDFGSPGDGLYDSVRTRATSTSSGIRGPAIEKLFDDSRAAADASISSSAIRYPSQKFSFSREGFGGAQHGVIEEEESVSTPVRAQHNGLVKSPPEAFIFVGSSPQQAITSSPPAIPSLLQRKPSEPASDMQDDDDSPWLFGEDDEQSPAQLPLRSRFPHFDFTADRLSPFTKSQGSSSLTTTPSKVGIIAGNEKDARSSIFDWSEQQPVEKSPGNRSPPRPRTVHGKKDAENRGSRPAGRRAPSAAHGRSQSVPAVPETESKRSHVVTNKFGTWGVGSKGITEDWNEDFDFEEIPPLPVSTAVTVLDEKRLNTGMAMFVPKSIREQQNNVLANIGLLRDWGLLIEELKELRTRAVQLKLLSEEKVEVWNEVDAMIDLADQESNDHTLAPQHSPPSSPGFDYDAFDEAWSASPQKPSLLATKAPNLSHEDVFDTPSPSPVRKGIDTNDSTTTTPRRPRKDSEAVARSVIEALQQRRNISDPTPGASAQEPTQKVPFDTATLKRIVPHVQELRDKVKRSIREAEGLYISPQPRVPAEDPSFSRIFRGPPDSPSGNRRSRRSTAATDHVMPEDSSSRSPDDLTARMKLMTVI